MTILTITDAGAALEQDHFETGGLFPKVSHVLVGRGAVGSGAAPDPAAQTGLVASWLQVPILVHERLSERASKLHGEVPVNEEGRISQDRHLP